MLVRLPTRLWLDSRSSSPDIYNFLIPIYLIALWLRNTNKSRQTVISIALVLLIAVTLSYLIGLIWFLPRPFMVGPGYTLIAHRPNSSFPSNHGIVFVCCAAVLFVVGAESLLGWPLVAAISWHGHGSTLASNIRSTWSARSSWRSCPPGYRFYV